MLTFKQFTGFEMNADQYILKKPFVIINEQGEEVSATLPGVIFEAVGNYLLKQAEKARAPLKDGEQEVISYDEHGLPRTRMVVRPVFDAPTH
jgi:hypothetical protein